MLNEDKNLFAIAALVMIFIVPDVKFFFIHTSLLTSLPTYITISLYQLGGCLVYKIKEMTYTKNFEQGSIWMAIYLPTLFWPLTIIWELLDWLASGVMNLFPIKTEMKMDIEMVRAKTYCKSY